MPGAEEGDHFGLMQGHRPEVPDVWGKRGSFVALIVGHSPGVLDVRGRRGIIGIHHRAIALIW